MKPNLSYLGLIYQTNYHHHHIDGKSRRLFRIRSLTTLSLAVFAMGFAFWQPIVSFSLICACFFLYLRPGVRET
ncbi:hypothetical protein [Puia sp.]|jgi:hypothetical protein|uniref:hypothetical protein n=1 Tax=Puia sp. TaxID=2045100 RepID=UPI002F3FC85C